MWSSRLSGQFFVLLNGGFVSKIAYKIFSLISSDFSDKTVNLISGTHCIMMFVMWNPWFYQAQVSSCRTQSERHNRKHLWRTKRCGLSTHPRTPPSSWDTSPIHDTGVSKRCRPLWCFKSSIINFSHQDVQGGQSGRWTLFADIKLKAPTEHIIIILKGNSYWIGNKRLS